jgi:Tfp pilus assembly protein PilO
MFGFAEAAALAGSGLILFLVLFSYLYFQVPARSRLASLQAERAALQVSLRKANEIVHQGRDTKTTVDNITQSMDAFENKGLVRAEQGRMSLYDELNQLIIKNGLRNTSGPTYTALEPSGSKTSTGKSANTKWQSVYPGIGVAVTVEGQYQNLRHFIKDIENTRQLIIINQVELQRATETNAPSGQGASGAGPRASLVSLQLNMATYFQRDNSNSSPVGAGQN